MCRLRNDVKSSEVAWNKLIILPKHWIGRIAHEVSFSMAMESEYFILILVQFLYIDNHFCMKRWMINTRPIYCIHRIESVSFSLHRLVGWFDTIQSTLSECRCSFVYRGLTAVISISVNLTFAVFLRFKRWTFDLPKASYSSSPPTQLPHISLQTHHCWCR